MLFEKWLAEELADKCEICLRLGHIHKKDKSCGSCGHEWTDVDAKATKPAPVADSAVSPFKTPVKKEPVETKQETPEPKLPEKKPAPPADGGGEQMPEGLTKMEQLKWRKAHPGAAVAEKKGKAKPERKPSAAGAAKARYGAWW